MFLLYSHIFCKTFLAQLVVNFSADTLSVWCTSTRQKSELTEVICVTETAGVCVHYIWLQCVLVCTSSVYLCPFVWIHVLIYACVYTCGCTRAVVMIQSGRSILKTLSGRIDFLFPHPWKCSCNTAGPPSFVTLSFCDMDQSKDELEIATQRPWTLSGGRGGGDVSDRNTQYTGSCIHRGSE